MAEKNTGPVKPPVLDLKATKASAKPAPAKPATGARPAPAKQSSTSKPAPAKTTAVKPALSARTSARTSRKPAAQDAKPTPGAATGAATASAEKSAPGAATAPPLSASPSPTRPFILGPAIGALAGALLAIIIMLALLVTGILQPLLSPAKNPDFAALSNRVGINKEQITEGLVGYRALDEKVSALNNKLNGFTKTLESQSNRFQVQIDDLNQQLDKMANQYESLNKAFAGLKTTANTKFDPAPLENEITRLGAKIDAIAAGASTGDAQKLATDLSAIRDQLAIQEQKLAALQDQLKTIKTPLATVSTLLGDTRQELAQNQLKIGKNSQNLAQLAAKFAALPPPANKQNIGLKALQLPLALMGIESALDQGRPFAGELQSLKLILPDLKTDRDLATIAKDGLLRPDQLVAGFERRLPAMLGARPANPNASWQQAILARLKSLIALRPTQKGDLTGIDGLIVSAENAVKRRDFAAAAAAIAQMPAPMQAALGKLDLQIADMGAMQTLLAAARSKALAQTRAIGATQ